MTLRDMTPEELELFEEALVQDMDEPRMWLEVEAPEVAGDDDRDAEVPG